MDSKEKTELSARELLRVRNVEIDLSDHRAPEEIVLALGLVATKADFEAHRAWHQDIPYRMYRKRPDSPYFVQ